MRRALGSDMAATVHANRCLGRVMLARGLGTTARVYTFAGREDKQAPGRGALQIVLHSRFLARVAASVVPRWFYEGVQDERERIGIDMAKARFRGELA